MYDTFTLHNTYDTCPIKKHVSIWKCYAFLSNTQLFNNIIDMYDTFARFYLKVEVGPEAW